MATVLTAAGTNQYVTFDAYGDPGIGSTVVVNTVVWACWNYEVTAGTACNVWPGWNQAYTVNQATALVFPQTAALPNVTPEKLSEMQERIAKEEARIAKAREKAQRLLKTVLNKKQQEQFERDKSFELQVNNRFYRIRPGYRVERLDPASKKVLSYFCIHPDFEHNLPAEDVALGQKLMLESAEAEFLRIANETRAA